MRTGVAVLLAACLGMAGRSSWAQSELGRGAGAAVPYPYGPNGGRSASFGNANTPAASAGVGTPSSMYGNLYAVPTMNPFLNPYAAMYADASPTTAALYFIAAQQSSGGIGSGRLSGVRPAPSAAAGSRTAVIPTDRRVSEIPGAGAARYFHRSFGGGTPPLSRAGSVPQSYYNRYGNYYSTNGH